MIDSSLQQDCRTNIVAFRQRSSPTESLAEIASSLSVPSLDSTTAQMNLCKSLIEKTKADMHSLWAKLPAFLGGGSDDTPVPSSTIGCPNRSVLTELTKNDFAPSKSRQFRPGLPYKESSEAKKTQVTLSTDCVKRRIDLGKSAPSTSHTTSKSSLTKRSSPCTSGPHPSESKRVFQNCESLGKYCKPTQSEHSLDRKKQQLVGKCSKENYAAPLHDENCGTERNVLLKHVYAVNGAAVTFKGENHENFKNWFGNDIMLRKEKKFNPCFHVELDLWEYSNREITMGLYCGNILIVKASKEQRGGMRHHKVFSKSISIPPDLTVESLIFCRNRAGRIVIQERDPRYSDNVDDIYKRWQPLSKSSS